ncbi:MAG TPA: NADPH:quinone reductase [Myxococcales bacterium]|nr:NADPH:quinone reductase [Myxococcales bacterium]
MIAAWYEATGPAREVLRYGEIPQPEPDRGEVRVRVHASGVNPTDTKQRAGRPRPGSAPLAHARVIPHQDGAGVIDSVGEGVSPERIGERVWIYEAQWQRPSGTAAQYTTVPEERAVPLPAQVDFAAGACLGIPAITAHHCLFGDGPIAGKTVLVQGAAGAVGYYAAQLAKLGGARVIATVGSPEQHHLVREAGIAHIVDRKREDVKDRVLRLTEGRGVDRIVEVALVANLDTSVAVLATDGVIATYASDAEPQQPQPFPFRPLLFKNATIRFVLVYLASLEAHRAAVREINAHLASGALKHSIARRLPLSKIVEAHEAMEAGHLNGKVILDVP